MRFLLMLMAAGCTGEVERIGVTEPLRLIGGSFKSELLEGGLPEITSIESSSGIATSGQLDRAIVGRASEDAFAVAIRFAELGTGWWVTPIGAIDPMTEGQRDFALRFDLGPVPAGIHRLRFAAIDAEGRSGPPSDLDLCVLDPGLLEDLSPCSDRIRPPAAAVLLSWNEDVDLDLVVVTPEGERIDARHPQIGSVTLTQDSNPGCDIDARNVESVFFGEDPPPGTHLLYANLFEACGHRSASFVLTVHRRQEVEGRERLVEVERRSGILLGASANGGAGAPLYVSSLSF